MARVDELEVAVGDLVGDRLVLAGLLARVVLALQASYTFTGQVPLYFVGALVGKTMILELGPVLTALVVAGRVGAGITAELGAMAVSEQASSSRSGPTTRTKRILISGRRLMGMSTGSQVRSREAR